MNQWPLLLLFYRLKLDNAFYAYRFSKRENVEHKHYIAEAQQYVIYMFSYVYNFLAKYYDAKPYYTRISFSLAVRVCVPVCVMSIYRFWCLFNSHYDRWKYD